MYCPKCSHQQASEDVRFCSRCGFQLDNVREFLANEGTREPGISLKDAKRHILRQVDILIGAGFMLIGVIKAALVAANVEGPRMEGIIFGLLMLGLGLAMFLLFAQLSPRQRGLTLGATLMFAGALVGLPMLAVFGLPGIFLLAMFLFPIIIFWTRLARMFMRTFFEKDVVSAKAAPQLLEPSQSSIEVGRSKRMKTADLAQPPSITEDTTTLLEKS